MRPCLLPSTALFCAALLCGAAAWAQGVPEQGFRIISTGNLGNCLACHALKALPGEADRGGQRGLDSSFAPALDKVGTRYSAEQLRQWVTDARLVKPGTLMPPFGTTQGTTEPIRAQSILSPEQIEDVVAALQSLR